MNQSVDDSRLLAALAEGDVEALGALYDAYARRVYNVLLARGLEREEAEDILQDAFLSLLDLGRAVRRIANLQAYLITVARNMASRRLGRRRRQARLALVAPLPAGPTPADPTQKIAARDALRQLPPEQTEVVALKVWDEMTFAEIGAALDIPPNTAASRYRYALEKLRSIWEAEHDEA
ncbi:MAG: sigma-70 family RNA polymerase sigma factor [Armatimonadota bacterium]|jgi:RNA polymerase sigma-70 factor (ECF subfamily)